MSKILITGGAGFVGSHLAEYLKIDNDVVVIDDLSGGFDRNIPEGVAFYKVDITDKKAVDRVFELEKPEYVYHLACFAAEGLSHFIKSFIVNNVFIGSTNIINSCVNYNVKKLIFTSSMAVYGSNQTPFREDMIPTPEDIYGICKYGVEMDLKATKELFGLDYTIFRPHNIVGTKQNIGDSYRNVVGIFINQIMQGKPMTIFGDGTQTRAFSYIEDMLPYLKEAMTNLESNGKIYNIGGETPYTINKLSEEIRRYYPQADIVNEPARYEVHTAYSDHTRLYEDFGKLSELTTIDIWLKEFIDYCEELGPQDTTKFSGIEIEKNLPPKRKALLI